MKKIFLLLICLLTIGLAVFSNSMIVYASDDETDIALASTDRLFSYSVGGMTYTSNVSLDDAWNKAMKSQYELGNLGLDDIGIEYGLYNSGAINHIIPNENSRSSSRNPEEDGIKVHLEWQPTSNGDYIPLKYMKVQLYYIYYNNASPLTSIVLEEGYTDDNGDYIFTDTLSWKELLHPVSEIIDMFNGIELRVRICPESKTFKIQKDWLNILNLAGEVLTDWSIVDGIIEEFLSYSVITNSINVGYFNRNGDFGTIQIPYGIELDDPGGLAESNVLNRSFKVAQSLAMGQKFINEQGIDITNKVNVAYPAFYGSNMDTNAFCYYDYNLQSGLMCIGGLRDEWETMLHEYGHFVHASLNLFPFSWVDYAAYAISSIFGVDGGVNPEHLGDEDHISDPIYGKGKDIGTKFAWSEGWAESFSYIVQDYYWNDYYLTGKTLSSTGLEGVNPLDISYTDINFDSCEGQEWAITVFLNNLYNLQTDGLEMFLSSVKSGYINGEKIQTISKFVDSLLENYPGCHEEIGDILSECQISSKLKSISSFDTYNPPVISWQINGSQYTPLNQFEIKFYDVDDNEIYSINNIYTTKAYNDIFQYEISNSEWNNILTILGDSPEFGIEIYCYNTTGMLTGPYPSNRVICDTPYFFDFVLDEITNTYAINGITNVKSDDLVIIPNYYNNTKITKINDSAFLNCTQLSSIKLPLYLVEISSSAFKGCSSLSSITIPSSVQYIEDSAFENCVSLVSVIVEREISNITNLGNYAFVGCSSSLQIVVPQNRVAEYKNKEYWSNYKNRIVADDDDFSEIELHCLSDFYNSTSLKVNYNKLYKLNVLCGKSYQIIADSKSDVKINLYDSNMNLISTNANSLITYLGVNTYYMDMELENATSSEIITTTFELRWEHDGERIYYNDEHDLLTHLHQLSNGTYFTKLYYINNNGAGFYKVQISGNTQNGSLLSTELGTISIYNNSDKTIDQLLSKYPNSNEYAITNVGQDTMYVYLPRNGYFYIDVMMPSNNYESLDLTISNVESETIDLLSSMTSTYTKNVTIDNSLDEFAKKLIINQTSKYLITLNSSDDLTNNFDIIMFKQTFNSSSNVYKTYFKPINYITDTSTQKTFEVSLEAGVYFIYYYNNDTNTNIDLTLTRILQNNSNSTYAMQADPVGSGYNPGSEVRFNNGSRNNYTITEGFTRNMYFVLDNFYTYSRLDFDWYSSNESIATVSEFGTVFANNVSSNQTVTIYAVYREDPSLIYYRTFTVVDDTSVEEIVITCNMSYSYSEENGTYQIELNDTNSPYPWIQYYNWSIYVPCQENDIACNMSMWGEITASGPGCATLTGTYTINPRVKIIINLSITE